VGGHCIGVDPYYLTHKAQAIGYQPEIILAGRRINDGMGAYVVSEVVKLMIKKHLQIAGGKVLVLGLTFKENCPDLRNTRVVDIVNEFHSYDSDVDVYDPWIDPAEAEREYGITPIAELQENYYDAVLLAVAHREFLEIGPDQLRRYCKPEGVLYDVKRVLPTGDSDGRL